MATPLVIVGAGGFGRHAHAVYTDIDKDSPSAFDFLGFVDDEQPDMALLERLGARWLGPIRSISDAPADTRYVIGIGSAAARRRIDAIIGALGYQPATLVHPQASIGTDVRIGPGAVICAGARLMTNIELGRHVHINMNCTIGHDTDLADYVTLFPLAAVAGTVSVGAGTTIGTTASINQGLRIGADVMVGAGAAVIRDLPDGVTAVGVPASYR